MRRLFHPMPMRIGALQHPVKVDVVISDNWRPEVCRDPKQPHANLTASARKDASTLSIGVVSNHA